MAKKLWKREIVKQPDIIKESLKLVWDYADYLKLPFL